MADPERLPAEDQDRRGREPLGDALDGHRLREVLASVMAEQLRSLEVRLLSHFLGNPQPGEQSSDLQPLLTERDLADLMQCHPRTLRRLELAGEIPKAVRFGGSKRWRTSDIQEWLEHRETKRQ